MYYTLLDDEQHRQHSVTYQCSLSLYDKNRSISDLNYRMSPTFLDKTGKQSNH